MNVLDCKAYCKAGRACNDFISVLERKLFFPMSFLSLEIRLEFFLSLGEMQLASVDDTKRVQNLVLCCMEILHLQP